jgi:uncharacterized membrane protein (UPF0127 family)
MDVPLRISNVTRQTELAHCVDVADRGAKRRKGLLGRKMLPVGEGLWIVPCESVHTFGMQFPIDLVYLDRQRRVKKVRNDVPPWRMSACLSAHSVLELASGSIRRTGTKPGDRLEFSSALALNDRRTSPDAPGATLPQSENERGIARLTHRQKLQAIAEFLVVGICTLAFLLTIGVIGAALLGRDAAGTRDFVSYWAAGQQLVHHANPYDADAILRIERSVGFPGDRWVLIMRNPPPALLLALPLGFFGPRVGLLLWELLLLACLVASVRTVWIMHGRPKNQLILLAYSFAPVLVCLLGGQTALFVLLGLVGFLHLHRTRPFLAGVSLWLCALKPHLFLPFCFVLLVWAIVTRSYKILAGTAVALCISTAIALILDPLVWVHYSQMLSAAQLNILAIPCLSIRLRQIVSPHSLWIQYLPAAIGCVWALAYFRKHSDKWNWMEHGSRLMLVSVVVAPYAWITDQAILIPALLHGVYLTRSRSLVAVLALASAVIEIGIFRGVQEFDSAFYIWTAPGWLVWYLFAVRAKSARPRNADDTSSPADGVLLTTVRY